jgi:MFS family permease
MIDLAWWREATPEARRALVAAALGWMLDAFDVMLFALVLPAMMPALGIDLPVGGLLGSLTLAASAVGGVVFGFIADRYGRTRALTLSILLYSGFTAACGFAQNVWQLAVLRVCLGLGFGGEWASGAALVAETWPAEHRGKALGLVQSAWAIGYGLAALVTMWVLPRWGWRAVFFVGVAPALVTFWIRRAVREPQVWVDSRRADAPRLPVSAILRGSLGRATLFLALMNACTMFAYWGFNSWVPTYLAAAPALGGVGLETARMTAFVVVMQVGTWLGYVTFGFVSDRAGRKRTYVVYLLAAAVLMQLYVVVKSPLVLLALGPVLAFFGTGHFSGFGAVTADLYPTAIRATAQGFTYNVGRLASAAAPFLVGTLAQQRGFGLALSLTGVAYLTAALLWAGIPQRTPRSE